MPEESTKQDKKPTLTIDFVGLCAFVAHGDSETPDKVTVLMMDAEKAAPKDALCRHDPVLVFDKRSFRGAGPDTDHLSFTGLNGKDVGIWNLRDTDLRLELVDPTTTTPLKLDCSYHRMLGLETLTCNSNEVDRRWVDGWQVPGTAARLTIEHGMLEADTLSDPWFVGTKSGGPSGGSLTFHQVVRWVVSADTLDAHALRLSAGPTEWVAVAPDVTSCEESWEPAKVFVSNLCPLATGNNDISEDVLAYYAMSVDEVSEEHRFVLYRNKNAKPPTTGEDTRPGSDACPPVKGISS